MSECVFDKSEKVFANKFKEEIVRCRDCWDVTEHSEHATFFTCGYFDSRYAEVEPDGFCKWASRRAS